MRPVVSEARAAVRCRYECRQQGAACVVSARAKLPDTIILTDSVQSLQSRPVDIYRGWPGVTGLTDPGGGGQREGDPHRGGVTGGVPFLGVTRDDWGVTGVGGRPGTTCCRKTRDITAHRVGTPGRTGPPIRINTSFYSKSISGYGTTGGL